MNDIVILAWLLFGALYIFHLTAYIFGMLETRALREFCDLMGDKMAYLERKFEELKNGNAVSD